jgi:hypothetical protein
MLYSYVCMYVCMYVLTWRRQLPVAPRTNAGCIVCPNTVSALHRARTILSETLLISIASNQAEPKISIFCLLNNEKVCGWRIHHPVHISCN